MGIQPETYRVIQEPKQTSSGFRVDEQGYIALSDRDVQRIAVAVAKLLGVMTPASDPSGGEGYVPVRRNKAQTRFSEYE